MICMHNFEEKLNVDQFKAKRFKASFLDYLIVEIGPKICLHIGFPIKFPSISRGSNFSWNIVFIYYWVGKEHVQATFILSKGMSRYSEKRKNICN